MSIFNYFTKKRWVSDVIFITGEISRLDDYVRILCYKKYIRITSVSITRVEHPTADGGWKNEYTMVVSYDKYQKNTLKNAY